MKTVFYNDFTAYKAIINPVDFIKPIPNFPEICISTFSKQIIDKLAALEGVEVIATLQTANGENPIYRIVYKGKEFAFYLSLVCAPASASCMEEVIALGAKKFVFFGCCGVLDEELVGQKLIVPIAAIRDEGTSYHYIAPSDEISPDDKATALLEETMKRCGCSYVTGKIWTTDGFYRETERAVKERKGCGCVAVDMEYSALLAVAKYRKIPFIQFFYGADSLDNGEWNPRDLTEYGLSNAQKYFVLALECGLALEGAIE